MSTIEQILCKSAETGNLEIIKEIITADDVDVHYLSDMPLRLAIQHERVEVVRYLLDFCAERINDLEGHSLILSVDSQNVEMTKILLVAGADPNCSNGMPLLDAVHHENLEIINLLLENGANPNISNGRVIRKAMYSEKREEIIEILSNNGGFPEFIDAEYIYVLNSIKEKKEM